jgi:hypothetical protein
MDRHRMTSRILSSSEYQSPYANYSIHEERGLNEI